MERCAPRAWAAHCRIPAPDGRGPAGLSSFRRSSNAVVYRNRNRRKRREIQFRGMVVGDEGRVVGRIGGCAERSSDTRPGPIHRQAENVGSASDRLPLSRGGQIDRESIVCVLRNSNPDLSAFKYGARIITGGESGRRRVI